VIERAVAAGAAAASAAFAMGEFGEHVVTGFRVDVEILTARDGVIVSDHEIRFQRDSLSGLERAGSLH
jgi:hypothetical protein